MTSITHKSHKDFPISKIHILPQSILADYKSFSTHEYQEEKLLKQVMQYLIQLSESPKLWPTVLIKYNVQPTVKVHVKRILGLAQSQILAHEGRQ